MKPSIASDLRGDGACRGFPAKIINSPSVTSGHGGLRGGPGRAARTRSARANTRRSPGTAWPSPRTSRVHRPGERMDVADPRGRPSAAFKHVAETVTRQRVVQDEDGEARVALHAHGRIEPDRRGRRQVALPQPDSILDVEHRPLKPGRLRESVTPPPQRVDEQGAQDEPDEDDLPLQGDRPKMEAITRPAAMTAMPKSLNPLPKPVPSPPDGTRASLTATSRVKGKVVVSSPLYSRGGRTFSARGEIAAGDGLAHEKAGWKVARSHSDSNSREPLPGAAVGAGGRRSDPRPVGHGRHHRDRGPLPGRAPALRV